MKLDWRTAMPFVPTVSGCFVSQQRSRMLVTSATQLTKPKIFAIWLFRESLPAPVSTPSPHCKLDFIKTKCTKLRRICTILHYSRVITSNNYKIYIPSMLTFSFHKNLRKDEENMQSSTMWKCYLPVNSELQVIFLIHTVVLTPISKTRKFTLFNYENRQLSQRTSVVSFKERKILFKTFNFIRT